LSADELFDVLVPPRNPDLIGAYRTFLTRKVLPELRSPTDLEVALGWVLEVPRGWHPRSPPTNLVDEILVAAWPLAATSESVAEAVAMLVAFAIRERVSLFNSAKQRHLPLEEVEARRLYWQSS
jgi:hypothetical protein